MGVEGRMEGYRCNFRLWRERVTVGVGMDMEGGEVVRVIDTSRA